MSSRTRCARCSTGLGSTSSTSGAAPATTCRTSPATPARSLASSHTHRWPPLRHNASRVCRPSRSARRARLPSGFRTGRSTWRTPGGRTSSVRAATRDLPSYDPRAVERFWERQGWSRERLDIRWDFDSREDFEAVVSIEFAPEHADLILAEHPDATGVDYAVNLWYRRF